MRYDDLKKIAREVRYDLASRGLVDLSSRSVRRKPRDPEKRKALFRAALQRLDRHTPFQNSEGRLLFPYFTDYLVKRLSKNPRNPSRSRTR